VRGTAHHEQSDLVAQLDRRRSGRDDVVTNVHGPDHPLRLGGASIVGLIPLSATTGNVTVAFAALSYADAFVVTVVADPEHVPDLLG
jgi:hypothetical protein